MSPFSHKDWKDDPDTTTPLSAAALEDMEDRLGAYTDSTVTAHTGDTSAAHAASAISVTPTGSIAATDAQAALAEVASDAATALSGHTGASSGAHAATAISFTPNGSIAASTVQAAIQEVRDEAVGGSGSGLPANVVNRTTSYTAAAGDLVLCDATGGAFTVTLPAGTVGQLVTVKKTDSSTNAVSVVVTAGGTIDGDSGGASIASQHYGAVLECSAAGVWRIVSVTAAGIVGVADASDTVKGSTKLSVAAASAANPIAVGSNDPKVTADQAAGTASIRTLGTGAQQAAAGNHTHAQADVTGLVAGLAAKADLTVTINDQTGTSYTLVLGDAAKLVRVSNAGTHTLTIPPNSSVAFPVGTVVNVARVGAGAVNIAAGGGVTINSPGGLLGLRAQYSQATLIKTLTDTWLLGGDIA